MTLEEQMADLQRRLARVEQIITPMVPLGPSGEGDHTLLEKERQEAVRLIVQKFKESNT